MLLLRDQGDQVRAPPKLKVATAAGIGDRYGHRVAGPASVHLVGFAAASGGRSTAKHDVLTLVRLSGRVHKAVTSAPIGDDLVVRLNRLLKDQGVSVLAVRLAHRALTRRFSVDRLPRAEARRSSKAIREREDGTLDVSLWRGRRVLGSLVVSTEGQTPTREAIIQAVAEGVAAAAHEILLLGVQAAAADAKADAEARERLIRSAWSAGQDRVRSLRASLKEHHHGAGLAAAELLEALDAIEFHNDWAAAAADLVPASPRAPTLQSSLRRLTRWLDAASDMRVLTEVRGRPRSLDPSTARAIYVAAFECLTVAWDLRSCSRVRVELEFGSEVVLVVLDDGVGQRPWSRLTHALHTLLDPVDGGFDIKRRRRGWAVRIAVPGSVTNAQASALSRSPR